MIADASTCLSPACACSESFSSPPLSLILSLLQSQQRFTSSFLFLALTVASHQTSQSRRWRGRRGREAGAMFSRSAARRPGRWENTRLHFAEKGPKHTKVKICWGHTARELKSCLWTQVSITESHLFLVWGFWFLFLVTPVGWFRIFQRQDIESGVWTSSVFPLVLVLMGSCRSVA